MLPGNGVIVFSSRGFGNTGSFDRFVLLPSTALAIVLSPFNHLPSFLPSFAAIFPPRPASARICYWRRCNQRRRSISGLFARDSRGKLNSFYLFIRAVVSFSLSLSFFSLPSYCPLTFRFYRCPLLSFYLFLFLFESTEWKLAEEDIVGARRNWRDGRHCTSPFRFSERTVLRVPQVVDATEIFQTISENDTSLQNRLLQL